MYKQAIKLDPDYADSYASLADLYNTYYNRLPDTARNKSEYMQLQKAYIDTAYQLDPNSAEVNYAKGCIYNSKNENEKAFNSFKTAIKINPNSDQYYFEIGIFLMRRGCINLAIKCLGSAIEINPLIQTYYFYRGRWHLYLREYDKAEKDLIKAYEIDPNFFGIQYGYYLLFLMTKQYDEAEKSLVQMETNHPDELIANDYALLHAVKGQKEKSLNTFNSEDEILFPIWIYSILGIKDEAISLLQNQLDQSRKINRSRFPFLKNNAFYDNIRSDPRFQEILAKHKEIYEDNLAKYGDIDI
jgi:tetratricopeptide (TPR) repeat protein